LEQETNSINCAATNFKNELTLFFLKDMNQFKTNLHIIYLKLRGKYFISKPIIRVSFQKQLVQDQSITDAQSIKLLFGWFP